MHISLPVMVVRLRRAQHRDHGGQGIILLRVTRSAKQWPWQSAPWQPSRVTTKAIKWTGLPGSTRPLRVYLQLSQERDILEHFLWLYKIKYGSCFAWNSDENRLNFLFSKKTSASLWSIFVSNPVDCINECHIWSKKITHKIISQ